MAKRATDELKLPTLEVEVNDIRDMAVSDICNISPNS